jgi:hypothetical protein
MVKGNKKKNQIINNNNDDDNIVEYSNVQLNNDNVNSTVNALKTAIGQGEQELIDTKETFDVLTEKYKEAKQVFEEYKTEYQKLNKTRLNKKRYLQIAGRWVNFFADPQWLQKFMDEYNINIGNYTFAEFERRARGHNSQKTRQMRERLRQYQTLDRDTIHALMSQLPFLQVVPTTDNIVFQFSDDFNVGLLERIKQIASQFPIHFTTGISHACTNSLDVDIITGNIYLYRRSINCSDFNCRCHSTRENALGHIEFDTNNQFERYLTTIKTLQQFTVDQ